MRDEIIQLPHTRIAVRHYGDESLEKIYAFHGWLDNADSFVPLAEYLGDFHLIAVDWAGHGLSDHRSEDGHYHFVDWIHDMNEVVEYFSEDKVNLLGHSLGGMVAQAYTAAFPEKVSKLVSIECLGFLTSKAEETRDNLRKGILSRMKVRDKKKTVHPEKESAAKARKMVGDFSFEVSEKLVERNLQQIEDGWIWRSDSRLTTQSLFRLTEEQADNLMEAITCPFLFIHGEKGMDIFKKNLNKYKDRLKSLQEAVVSGGHHCHMEYPQQVAEIIKRFYSG